MSAVREIGLIWAQSSNLKIGEAGRIPWEVPEDMARFKAVTMDHPVIMGRKTWESLPERFRPLPGRRNIVVTRNRSLQTPGAETCGGVGEALALAGDETVWIIGGGEIYRSAMPFATTLHVTEIDVEVPGDTDAPSVEGDWITETGDWLTSRVEGRQFRFVEYGKATQPS
ncbi:dihydrofolate reductase [Rhodococcus sp. NPDC078407]|uniref:dihydrofolate reductase n=1 Tax=Rhodococcus sp. NPDC078407 TaxID=3364509 RepID=UPI0037C8060E